MSTAYKVGDLDEYFRNSQTEERELSFRDTNKFEEIYNLWMDNPSFAKFEEKDDSFKSVFGKFFKKSKKKSQMASMNEDDVDESIMKLEKKIKKMKRVRMSTEDGANISNVSELNDSASKIQKTPQSNLPLSPSGGSGMSKRKRKFNTSQQANLEINDNHDTDSASTKKKRKKNKSQADDSKADTSNVADLADSVLDESADVTFDETSASNISAMSLASDGSLKKKKKKKKKLQQLANIGTPNQMNESTNNEEEQMVIDASPLKNKKKRKNKKKKLAQNGTASILDGGNNSLGEQDESPNAKIDAQIKDTIKSMRKLNQSNISTDDFADDESIDDQLDDSEGAVAIDEGSKKKKKGNKWLEANKKSEVTSPILSKKEAKMLKKKNKKLKGIVSGLDTELELTKFSSKSDEMIDDENDMKDEDENDIKDDDDDSAESDNEKGSFPRTPNKKFMPKEEESQERLDRTLFVGNLPTDVDQKILKDIFKGMGKVESVRLRCAVPPKPSMSQKVANIKHEYHKDATSLKGFVVFEEKEDAEKALALNGTVFNGNHIRVDKAFGRKPRPQDGKSPVNNKGPQQQQQYDNKDTLFLGNLPYNVDDETLWNTFTNCGTVKSVRVVRDNGTGIGKGFGFVQFEDSSGIEQALALDGTEVNGRPMRVKLSENKQRSEGPRRFQNQQNRSFGSGPQRRFGFNKFRGRGGGQDSGPRKTFKKMNNNRKMEQEKKKIAGIFKTDKS